ncbi:MAG: tricarballylate utilization 4Fe-4S protein TcuB [Pseudomonadales bacterium]|nr:tricarballylate utilization 4Fe-4S protein TcuB [Pseudomonadales bacterium]MBO6821731.1 tricarballylate utilization 4Fe-4S protein TcuB [Pseudomonadales bacterium]
MQLVETSPQHEEGARIMTICNACRYCEGHCAVFPAMEKHLTFDASTIEYLANLCHQCGACFQHCQYAEPHEFAVNVPDTFAAVRTSSYVNHIWPGMARPLVRHGRTFSFVSALLATTVFSIGVYLEHGGQVFSRSHDSFYEVIPHGVMAGTFSVLGVAVLLVWTMSLVRFWRILGLPSAFFIDRQTYVRALKSMLTLENLGGGHGKGCYQHGERASQIKRWFHHLTMYGFLLCFAATSLGTVYHYVLQFPAPYDWLTGPKLLGTLGGVSLLFGSAGLYWSRRQTTPEIDTEDYGMGVSLIVLLFATSLSGLALPLLKDSSWLGVALCLHLGIVVAMFTCFAWGKFMHGMYRAVALIKSEHDELP